MGFFHYFFSRKWYYHLTFWLLYSGFWHYIFAPDFFSFYSILVSGIYLIFYLVSSYTNIYVLVPRYLNGRQYVRYIFSVTLLVLTCALLLGLSLHAYFKWMDPSLNFLGQDRSYLAGAVLGSIFSTVALTMILKLFKQRIENDQKEKEKNQERLETELKFLKDQLNPHFLFNAINSIYVLIKKDPEVAAHSLAQFSDMLRYQLYECDQPTIALEKEVAFLKNYVALAALRKENLQLDTHFDPRVNGELVSPMLLTPIVENAFKHLSNYREVPNWIHLALKLQPNQRLILEVVNSQDPTPKQQPMEPPKAGGIGLANVKKRLELLHPQQYRLEIENQDSSFSVKLEIPVIQKI